VILNTDCDGRRSLQSFNLAADNPGEYNGQIDLASVFALRGKKDLDEVGCMPRA